MNTININGKSISVQGNNVSVIGNKVYVDGKLVEEGLSGYVEISFTGDLANLKVDGSVNVKGNIHGNVDVGGSVTCGNVNGSVDAGGSITCGSVDGNVDAGGSVSIR
ncbi:hypothetical protein [Sporosarcina sp. FSL W7-1283]|uniref:hypothetical protein n=1 Tax=Sporosarcina sp. FSL W7-1283 TaxID=2921560 RepID=UPI0030F86A6A